MGEPSLSGQRPFVDKKRHEGVAFTPPYGSLWNDLRGNSKALLSPRRRRASPQGGLARHGPPSLAAVERPQACAVNKS